MLLVASIDRLNAVAELLVGVASSHFVQTALLALVLAVIDATLGRRIGAHWRCALWLIFFVKLALPPQLALPSSPAYWRTQRTPAPPSMMMPRSTVMSVRDTWSAADAPATPNPTAATPGPVPPTADAARPTWRLLLVAGWAAGVLVLGVMTLVQRRRLWTALRGSADAPALLYSALERARAEVGLRRSLRLRLTDTAVGPLVAGLLRPTVYLPSQLAANLTPEQLHGVLVHELLHVRRGDLWVAAVQTVARVLFFHHPAVWWVNAHLARLREEATDRAVLWHRKVDVHAYSLALVAAAEVGLGARRVSPFALGVIETKSQLEKRIQMNLSHPRPSQAHVGRSGLFSLAILALVLIPMAPAGATDGTMATPPGFKPIDAAAVARQIDVASNKIFAAFNRRDRDAFVAAFAADALVLPPGSSIQTGHTGAAEGYLRTPAGLMYEKIQWRDRQCYRIGRWVVETGLAGLQFKLNIDAPVMTDPRQALTIWEEGADGGLRVKVLAWNPLPQPPDLGEAGDSRAFELANATAPFSTKGNFTTVLEAEKAFHHAFEDKRFTDAAAYYAEQAILFSPETHPLRGRDAIRHYIENASADRSPQKIDLTPVHVEGNGDCVLVVNLFRWSVMPSGAKTPVSVAGKGVHLWQRGPDGSWKILFDLPNPSQRDG